MNKQFMVLGVKNSPVKDPSTEKDDPYIFNSLTRALEVAEATAVEESFACVVELNTLEVINYGCQS